MIFCKFLITNECGTVFGRQGPEAILDCKATHRVVGKTPAVKSCLADQAT